MNTTITMRETVYQKSDFRAGGNAISAKIQRQDFGEIQVSRQNAVYVDVIEAALSKLVDAVRGNGSPAAVVTITGAAGYTLPAGTKTYLSDKYVLQPEIASITFA